MTTCISQLSIYNTEHPWPSDLRPLVVLFFFLKNLYWHSISVTMTLFLSGHINLTVSSFSCGDTVIINIIPYRKGEEPMEHTLSDGFTICSRDFVKSLYILLKMDYDHNHIY